MTKLGRNTSTPHGRAFWDNVDESARSLQKQPHWVSAGVYFERSATTVDEDRETAPHDSASEGCTSKA